MLIAAKAQSSNRGEAKPEDHAAVLKKLPLDCVLVCQKSTDGVVAKVTFTNKDKSTVSVLKRNLLSENTLTWSPFVITRDGAKVHYLGKTIKAAAPTARDYAEIKQGEEKPAEITLNKYYDVHSAGQYRIYYRAVQLKPNSVELFITESNACEFTIP